MKNPDKISKYIQALLNKNCLSRITGPYNNGVLEGLTEK